MSHRHSPTLLFICVFSVGGCVYHNDSMYAYTLQNVFPFQFYFIKICWISCAVAIKSPQKEQSAYIHRHHGNLFEDTFPLTLKTWSPFV